MYPLNIHDPLLSFFLSLSPFLPANSASSTTSTINMSPQPSTVLITGANRGEFNLDNSIIYTSLAPPVLVMADGIFI